jgi:DNA-binding NtrC family response regulator
MTKILISPLLAAIAPNIAPALQANGMRIENGELDLSNPSSPTWQTLDCALVTPAELLKQAEASGPYQSMQLPKPVVVATAQGSIQEAVNCLQQGASDYLELDGNTNELTAAIERALHTHLQLPSAGQADAGTVNLLGECPAMQRLRNQIQKVANTDSPVLIDGEPGAGKELIARALHHSSQRAQRPLITLNCASVPANLLDAELFGTSDANGHTQPGLLQAAAGGTLFLDEVAELPLEAQTRLLDVLELGRIRPVGATEHQPIDVRLLAATHRPLEPLAGSGQFRTDLYYRLSVFNLTAPPLRDRGNDILLLALDFAQRTAQRLDKPAQQISDEASSRLLAYGWPGNVRELANIIERAVIIGTSEIIQQSQLAIDISTPTATEEPVGPIDHTTLEDYFVKFVTENQDQLTETELSERLGISRKSLWERRQRLNIPRKRTKKRGPRREDI